MRSPDRCEIEASVALLHAITIEYRTVWLAVRCPDRCEIEASHASLYARTIEYCIVWLAVRCLDKYGVWASVASLKKNGANVFYGMAGGEMYGQSRCWSVSRLRVSAWGGVVRELRGGGRHSNWTSAHCPDRHNVMFFSLTGWSHAEFNLWTF